MISFAIRNTLRNTLTRKNATKAFYCNAAPAAAESVASKFDLPPAPAPPSNFEIGIVNDAGEVAFSAMNLGGWSSPVAWVQSSFEFLHISCDLPWWATIVTGTVIVRLITMPLLIQQQRYVSQMSKVMPEIQKLQKQISQSRIVGDDYETAQLSTKLMLLMKAQNVKPLRSLLAPMIQAPFFISFFMALSQMTNLPVESMKLGGLFWFEDLTVPDPFYILPLATCSTLLLTIEMSMSQNMVVSANSHLTKYFVRVVPVVMFPFLMKFEAAILCYWFSTNVFSFFQSIIFRQPKIRQVLNLGEIVKRLPAANETDANKSKGFVPDMREAFNNMKLAKRADDRRLADINNFKSAGLGPIIKTYKYDPTKTSSKI